MSEPRGRDTKRTPELEQKLLYYLKGGNYLKVACSAVGISTVTLHTWCKNDPELKAKVKDAMSTAETDIVMNWHSMTADDWRAAKEFLAARYPKKWGKKVVEQRVDQTTTVVDAADILRDWDNEPKDAAPAGGE